MNESRKGWFVGIENVRRRREERTGRFIRKSCDGKRATRSVRADGETRRSHAGQFVLLA